MKAVIQRVSYASVAVDGKTVGEIDGGFLVLLGVAVGDTEAECIFLADKIAKLRIFTDEDGKMNKSLLDFAGSGTPKNVLAVSQFTLCANARKGNRPEFFSAAPPEIAEPLYERFMRRLREAYGLRVEKGVFGAHMAVSLLNDGPVTILLDTDDLMTKKKES